MIIGFQLTHPWGCDQLFAAVLLQQKNFNSHTREGVTILLRWWKNWLKISTHTPVRVWLFAKNSLSEVNISTHTPVRVWLERSKAGTENLRRFQLTHPWGCDQGAVKQERIAAISTHTPVRVWRNTRTGIWSTYDFNSHTREGVTLHPNILYKYKYISTHTPVRVWLIIWKYLAVNIVFQLTHPWGCDMLMG